MPAPIKATKPKPSQSQPQQRANIGRSSHVLPTSTATPEGINRAALVRQLDRADALKVKHAQELAELQGKLAQQARDHRHDSLVIIASQAGDAAKLDPIAAKKFINQVLNADAKWNPAADQHGTKKAFPVREVMAKLLDAIAKESGGEQGVVDVRKLSPIEYAEHLRKRGLHVPALGYHNPV